MAKMRFWGNLLIFLSLVGFGLMFFPVIKTYLLPQDIPDLFHTNGVYISIPKISAYAPIVTNVDPWNESEYKEALEGGVAHAKGSALPGQKGRSFLFAHSSDLPWRMTRTNTPFLRLPEIEVNDSIFIFDNGKRREYRVYDKKEVRPSEVEYVSSQGDIEDLVLQTCIPIGTSLKRLLVFAKPVSEF